MLKRQINLNMIVIQFYYILSILKFEKRENSIFRKKSFNKILFTRKKLYFQDYEIIFHMLISYLDVIDKFKHSAMK